MLNIVEGKPTADLYFTKDNYYTKEEGIEHSAWLGEGARYLGLEGRVDPELFNELLGGLVEGQQLGRIEKGEIKHRSGWDLTLSAPKSLSILSEVYGVTELGQFHQAAVRETIRVAESLIDTRLTREGKTTVSATNNAVFATFTHDVSRNLDCNLHTHCYLLNMTHTENGWRSINTDRLFASQENKYLGKVYRSYLAKLLTDAGYSLAVHRDPSLFEIEGVSAAMLEEFSTRSKDIENWFKNKQIPYDSKLAKKVAVITRKHKKSVDREELHKWWLERAGQYKVAPELIQSRAYQEAHEVPTKEHHGPRLPVDGIGPSGITTIDHNETSISLTDSSRQVPSNNVNAAISQAIEYLLDWNASFSENALAKTALSILGDDQSQILDVTTAIETLVKNGRLLPAQAHPDFKHIKLWTLSRMKIQEAELLSQVINQNQTRTGLLKPGYVEKRLAKLSIDDRHRQVLQSLLTDTVHVSSLAISGGFDKAQLITHYHRLLDKKGVQVIGLSSNRQSALRLAKDHRMTSMTIDQYMVDPHRKRHNKPFRSQVLLVDEAEAISSQRINSLIKHAKSSNARILFVGDEQRLESVGAGRGFNQLHRSGQSAYSIHDDHLLSPSQQSLLAMARERDYVGAISTLNEQAGVVEISDHSDRIQQIADQWLSLDKNEQADTHLIASNQHYSDLNHAIREGLKAKGQFKSEELVAPTLKSKVVSARKLVQMDGYAVDDVIRFNQEFITSDGHNKTVTIGRGEYLTVVATHQADHRIALKSKKRRQLIYVNPAEVAAQEGDISLFKTERLSVAVGDKIRWLDNQKQLGFVRGTELTVGKVSKNWIRLDSSDGTKTKISFDDPSHLHFSHNYVVTPRQLHMAGRKKNSLLLMESNGFQLANARSFISALSNTMTQFTLYTDSYKQLSDVLSRHSGTNTEALNHEEFQRVLKNDPLFQDASTYNDNVSLLNKHRKPSRDPGVSNTAKKAVRRAINHIIERDMGFTIDSLGEQAMRFGLGQIVFSDIGDEIQRLIRNGDLLLSKAHADDAGLVLFTTPEMKVLEERLIDHIAKHEPLPRTIDNIDQLRTTLDNTHLNDQQKTAIAKALTTQERFYGIQGDPGVGKTTALTMYKSLLDEQGIPLIALASTHKAADELSKSINMDVSTVEHYIITESNRQQFNTNKLKYWLVDETSMLTTDRVVTLMDLAREQNARILFVGDYKQLESVGAGRGFKQLQDAGMVTSLLNHWVRPKTEITKEAFHLVMKGDYSGTVSLLQNTNRVTENKKEDALIAEISNAWVSLSAEARNKTMVVAPTNAQCELITDKIRQGLFQDGSLKSSDMLVDTFRDKYLTRTEQRFVGAYVTGDIVRFNNAHHGVGNRGEDTIEQREYFKVIGVNTSTNKLGLKSINDQRTLFIDPAKVGGNFDGGVHVFEEKRINLAVGDKIRWMDNKNELGLKRNQELVIAELSADTIRLQKKDGNTIDINTHELGHRHIVHDYAKTAYGAQGATKDNVMMVMSSFRVNTTNARSFMVALTRASENIHLYTDSVSELQLALHERSATNTEALTKKEFKQKLDRQLNHTQQVKRPRALM
ncbi:MAG: conjugative relaxase [Gammaproteobacteria bacterium]|nr:conjugative relaxase [Gammaproteobacteria bacterium]